MDVTTCLKSMLLAIRQYKNNRSAVNTSQLQKQINDLTGLKCSRLLAAGQVLPSECLSGLLEVAIDPKTNHALTSTIVSLLANLATSDEETREALHSSFNLTGALASIVHSNRATPEGPLVMQCLQVLQRFTYSMRISHCASYLDDLLTFLMQNIKSRNDDIIKPCLGLMANLCRHNLSVQTHIKSQSNVKALYRSLIDFLAHNSLTVVIYTLSILTSLTLNEEEGQKLFNAENIHQTFPLIFNITVNGDGSLTRNYAVDLLVDLVKNPKIADYLVNYKLLPPCLTEVFGLLHSKDSETAAKVLELLVSLCSVPGLRKLLCETMFRSFKPRRQPAGKKGGQARVSEPCVALLQWATGPLHDPERCSLQALNLLTELFEEVIDAGTTASVQSHLELLLPALVGLLQVPDSTEEEQQLKRHCVRVGRVVELLLVLCVDDHLKSLVAQQIPSKLCTSQVELLLSNSHGSSSPITDSDLSQVCAEAVLKMLELMSHLKQHVQDMETCFYQILQDQRMVTPLSLAMTSQRRELVQSALRVLFEAAPLPDFPSVILGESIAANNAYREAQRESGRSVKRMAVQESLPTGKACAVSNGPGCKVTTTAKQTIDSLIEKLQSGLEDPMKDVHMSEVIDVYEQKISALASKESRLEDLLEAKALALAQADRLLAQYRCQRAQAEAEARKLAGLLQESERGKEALQRQLGEQVLEVQRVKQDIQQLLEHNGRLQAVSDEHQALKGSYNQLLSRYNETERHLKELRGAHVALTQMVESLKKTYDTLRLKQERTLAEVAEKDKLIKSQQADLKAKEKAISDLQGELKKQQEQANEMEESISILRKELNKTEQARKDASIKASSLELQKSQLEDKMNKKEEELNKNMHMIAMIHSLSGGKIKTDTANVSL
ncbi:LOW QUALITY PROTEIN: protein CIP2A [Clupea harengus]|uniref:LOW QUALITY PROTEIN: protein CIP2A n=1 Tax=Clupea harengus TaxID=7950 RepID=A0A6P8GUZ9_CLUHA|nr:LOW QUALITY PROTEIN: protein CIP2A [Clupea harengus]